MNRNNKKEKRKKKKRKGLTSSHCMPGINQAVEISTYVFSGQTGHYLVHPDQSSDLVV